METKILLSGDFCNDEAVRFIARRYGTTPQQVLVRYLVQDGIMKENDQPEAGHYSLEPNELALMRDLGVKPSRVEIS